MSDARDAEWDALFRAHSNQAGRIARLEAVIRMVLPKHS